MPLQVEEWPIDKLIYYARNPRKNDEQVDRMCAAIREFGFRIPVVAQPDGLVVDGHLRIKAARRLGLESVPVALASDLKPEPAVADTRVAPKIAVLSINVLIISNCPFFQIRGTTSRSWRYEPPCYERQSFAASQFTRIAPRTSKSAVWPVALGWTRQYSRMPTTILSSVHARRLFLQKMCSSRSDSR
jgi:hypothetical protein